MITNNSFKWKHFKTEIILLNIRWYLKYALSFRDLVEMMSERGLFLAHTTIMRWVHEYAPEINKKIRKYLKPSNDSWRVDETYVKIKGAWYYLYRAIDSQGITLDFMLSKHRDKNAAKRFLKKVLGSCKSGMPRVINTDKNPSYPAAVNDLVKEDVLKNKNILRTVKYLNNIIEQDHRFIKKQTRKTLGFQSFYTAWRLIQGFEVFHMFRKRQVFSPEQGIHTEAQMINYLFGIA